MYIAAVFMSPSEETGDCVYPLHRIVRVPDYGRTQEEAEDLFPPEIFHKDPCDFFRGEGAAPHIRVKAERTVFAIVYTGVRKKGLQKDRISPLRKRHRVEPPAVYAPLTMVALVRTACTGQVILRIF